MLNAPNWQHKDVAGCGYVDSAYKFSFAQKNMVLLHLGAGIAAEASTTPAASVIGVWPLVLLERCPTYDEAECSHEGNQCQSQSTGSTR